MASIVLILSHPLLCHPEATVRTHLSGQSRNIWNVGGDGREIFYLGRFQIDCSIGVGRDRAYPKRNRPAAWLGCSRGSGDACHGRNRPDATFQGAPFEATRMGSRNDRAVVPETDVMPCLRN